LTKSRDRVRDLAEVFTNEHEINAMLDLVEEASPHLTYELSTSFFEPSCGTGNFVTIILERKLNF